MAADEVQAKCMSDTRVEFRNGSIMTWAKRDRSMHLDAAIVNAANASLTRGGGICGVIHREGGPQIAEECNRFQTLQAGMAVTTNSGALREKVKVCKVIHAVGPDYRGPGSHEAKVETLGSTYRAIMEQAEKGNIGHVFIPGISTGIYTFPKDIAAEVAVKSVGEWLENHSYPKRVTFVDTDKQYVDHLKACYARWIHSAPFQPLQVPGGNRRTWQQGAGARSDREREGPFFGHTPSQSNL
jgi:O-acetyl-ADP-ribose deacetylase (regulator of RNase III)